MFLTLESTLTLRWSERLLLACRDLFLGGMGGSRLVDVKTFKVAAGGGWEGGNHHLTFKV